MTAEEKRPVVLVGSVDDAHVQAVRDALHARGVEPVLLDSLRFPESPRIALGPAPDEILVAGRPLGFPGAVYLRSLYVSPVAFGVDVEREMRENWRKTMVVFREKAEMLVSVLRRWEERGVAIYNTVTASDAVRKPYQISRLKDAGLPVPDTLWTNDPDAVRRFARGRRIAYKPLAGGAATKELRPEDLGEERLARLANSPVTFQELLPGEDLRVFVLDGEVIAAYRITTSALDYRENEEKVESISLDRDLAAQCARAAAVTNLRFTGMDWKGAADGRPRILELNPSPMFLGFDRLAGTDVLGQLADALLRWK